MFWKFSFLNATTSASFWPKIILPFFSNLELPSDHCAPDASSMESWEGLQNRAGGFRRRDKTLSLLGIKPRIFLRPVRSSVAV